MAMMQDDDNAKLRAPVFLVGFMGVGKTTVGRALAQWLGLRFLDLDDLIEERAGMSVKEIFATYGETHFRQLESEAIQSCARLSDCFVALGGGAYVNPANRAMLRAIGKTVWLDCPFETCLERVALDGSRPLATDESALRRLFEQRRSAYAEADLSVAVRAGMSPQDVVQEALKCLSAAGILRLPATASEA